MTPMKLKRHPNLMGDPNLMNKSVSYFEALQSNLQLHSKKIKTFLTASDKAQITSFKIALLLAQKKKPHAEAEEIALPVLQIAAECMLTNEAVEMFKRIPLSSKTIARRIDEMSDDIKSQLIERFDDSKLEALGAWALQIDESTDISGKSSAVVVFETCQRRKNLQRILLLL